MILQLHRFTLWAKTALPPAKDRVFFGPMIGPSGHTHNDCGINLLRQISAPPPVTRKKPAAPKGFPGGPPPQYWPGLLLLNFRVRMGSGVFSRVWPLANDSVSQMISSENRQ